MPPARPQSLDRRELGFSPQPFVRWFHPFELARAGVRAVLAEMFGAYADRRELQAALYPRTGELAFDYSVSAEPGAAPPDELWLDYVADIGDGFDATYAVASLLARPSLSLRGPDGELETRRGRILIMGGDQVYPAASSLEYKERTVGPYRAALPFIADERAVPHLFAIPGNHDWYDGLSAFLRQFTQHRWIGAWKTRQQRSYFVLRLPHRIWVWGIDIQLHADIDGPQLAYFDAAAESLAPGDRLIICTAEPSWVEVAAGKRAGYENLAFVESKAAGRGARVVLVLTGDSHHYARYVEPALGRQYVTAGGGGAFLHGTHTLPLVIALGALGGERHGERRLERRATFPSPDESLAFVPHLLSFSLENKAFALLWSGVWLLTGWCLCSASVSPGSSLDATRTFAGALATIARTPGAPAIRQHAVLGCVVALALVVALLAASIHATRIASRRGAARLDPLRITLDASLWLTLTVAPALFVGLAPLGALLEALARSPMAVCLLSAVLLGSMVFVSHERKRVRAIVGAAHALVHVLLWLLIATGVAWWVVPTSAPPSHGWTTARELAIVAGWSTLSALLAGVASATVFGIYLWYAGKYLPEQLNDAFSAIGIDGYKNFVRLHIDREGTLTAYPVGLRTVPRRWVSNPDTSAGAPFIIPRDPGALAAELIEPPIVVARAVPEAIVA